MNLRFFIDRPVFSGVISVVIVLLGMISMFSLPVEQYPDIAPPTIYVFATYPGANAETVQKAVITPSGRSHQRSGRLDLYDFHGIEYGRCFHQHLFQTGNQRGHGGGKRAEPRERRTEPTSGGSHQDRCHH